ncbi:LuxR C-terminal-related transcriptional regulator [Nocardia gamkensis]|uniref:response regulator transcription factor n=1 Tax=Nocardia gamkensis TaxID=352869 RepID=UPI0033FB4FAD
MAIAMAGDYAGVGPAGRVRQGQRRRESELLARLTAARDAVFAAAGTSTTLPALEVDGSRRWSEAVAELIHLCVERLREAGMSGTETVAEFCALALDLQQLALDIYVFETAERDQRLANCAASLSRLRGIPDTAGLLDVACEEIVLRCGFQRAVLSRVEGSTWLPRTAHFAEVGGASWFADWIGQSIPFAAGSPESRLLSKRSPSLVHDTANAKVYRPIIIDAGHSNSYVAAAITHSDRVVGLIHADHYPSPRRTDETDRDVLWAFTDGLTHIYERTVLLESLRSQRDHVRELMASAVEHMDELCESGMEMARRGGRAQRDVGPSGYGDTGDLTVREAEIFRLMVEGATNRAIADRLVISEGTVKSHVKHILRKFGATNRAQAIAWSLRER